MFADLTAFLPHNLLALLVLYAGACVGHGFLMITALNVLYAWPLPHRILKYTRKLDLLVIVLGPLLFAYAAGLLDGRPRGFLLPYMVFCALLGLIVFPVCMLRYWLRRKPGSLLANHATRVDVAKELGYAPAGDGKLHRLTRIPFNQCFQVDFCERTFALPQLPRAWDGLRILHLSDLHFCGTPDKNFYRHVVDKCQSLWQPDIVAVTGDVVDSDRHHNWIIPILGQLKWNIAAFAILGNHDSWLDEHMIRRRLRRIGMDVLGNGWRQIDVRGEPLIVIGNEVPWFTPIPDLAACPEGIFRLCLSHTPDHIGWAKKHHIDLVLAGHVHGGQIRVPLYGSVFVPSRYGRHYDCGSFWEPPTLMHVSRGLAGQHPLRFNCRPEVTCIVLRCGEHPT